MKKYLFISIVFACLSVSALSFASPADEYVDHWTISLNKNCDNGEYVIRRMTDLNPLSFRKENDIYFFDFQADKRFDIIEMMLERNNCVSNYAFEVENAIATEETIVEFVNQAIEMLENFKKHLRYPNSRGF